MMRNWQQALGRLSAKSLTTVTIQSVDFGFIRKCHQLPVIELPLHVIACPLLPDLAISCRNHGLLDAEAAYEACLEQSILDSAQ
jgi:hypothetical protein